MFVMTSDISICGISVKPTAVKWRCSVSDYTDTCTIELPLSLYAKTNGGGNKSLPFYEGASRARQKLVVFAEMDESDCAFVLDAFAAANRYKVKPSTLSARQRLADFLQMANA